MDSFLIRFFLACVFFCGFCSQGYFDAFQRHDDGATEIIIQGREGFDANPHFINTPSSEHRSTVLTIGPTETTEEEDEFVSLKKYQKGAILFIEWFACLAKYAFGTNRGNSFLFTCFLSSSPRYLVFQVFRI